MAAPAKSKPTTVHFALIFFVMSTLILAVVAFLMSSQATEFKNKYALETKKLNEANASEKKATTDVSSLKKVVGHSFETVGNPGEQSATTVIGAMQLDIALAGQGLQENTYSAALHKLFEELRQMTSDRTALRADLDAEHAKFLALQKVYQSGVAEQTAARDQANAQLQERIKTSDDALASKDAEIVKKDEAYRTLEAKSTEEREELEGDKKKLGDRIKNLLNTLKMATDKLENFEKESFEVPTGLVQSVDYATKDVYVNLGSADKLPLRLAFSVYNKTNGGVARGRADIKGAIEITQILGSHLSRAHILNDEISNPIAAGDPIYTPIWNRGHTNYFSVVGLIDLDKDGHSDRALFHDIIEAAGARIDNEVDDDGKRSGPGINVNTKFLVVGDIPDLSLAKGDEVAERIAQDIIKFRKQMVDEAREQGVKVVSLLDFLNYMGYRPQRRMYKAAETKKWTLKSGARNSADRKRMDDLESKGLSKDGEYKDQEESPVSSSPMGPPRGGVKRLPKRPAGT